MNTNTNQNITFAPVSTTKEELVLEEREAQLSGEQELYKKLEAQNLLLKLRGLVSGGDVMGIGDVMLKAEEFLVKSAQQGDMDYETRKAIEDLSALVVTAKQMMQSKGIVDRLEKISDESQKALDAIKHSGVPAETKNVTEQAVDFVKVWRPLFQLLIRSRDFRQLLVDAITIARIIISRNSGEILQDISQQFVEGVPSKQIMKTAKSEISEKSNTQIITDEEWETLQDQIQRVLAILARYPNYREGIDQVFSLFDAFRVASKQISSSQKESTGEVHAYRAQLETEDLVASFAGREPLDQFKNHLRNLIDLFDNNPEFKQYFTELKQFIISSKTEEEVKSEAFKQKSKNLATRGRELIQQFKNENEVDEFLISSNELIQNIKNDEFVKILRRQAGIISSEFTFVDTEGKVQVDTDMLSKLQAVLLPVLADTLKYIPIPRIESSDSSREYWFDNITLCSYDVIPENIHFHLESDTDLSLNDIDSSSKTHLVIRLDKFRTELKDMKFYYKKKTFPVIEDNGVVSLRIGGDGATLKLIFTVVKFPGFPNAFLKEGYADFNISDMHIEFDKSTLSHDIILPLMSTLFKQQIQTQIENEVEKTLTKVVQQLAVRITQTLDEVNRPFLKGIESATQALKTDIISQRQKLLE